MNETQTILADMVDRLFGEHVTPALLGAVESGERPDRLWRRVEDQGLTRALAPERLGGSGSSWHDAYVILRAAGRHCVPLPLPETLAATWLLALGGVTAEDGAASLALADAGTPLKLSSDGRRLTGILPRVPWGRLVTDVVTVIDAGGQPVVAKVPRQGAIVQEGRNAAGEFRDTVILEDQAVQTGALPLAGFGADLGTLGALLRSAQMVGALSDILARSVTYANDRQQFGRPIGKYQAIQQNLAVMAAEVAAAEVAAEAAFLAADTGDPTLLAAVAKVRAGQAAAQAVNIAHQVHGAIGFTMEHPLQWRTRRLQAWRTEFGSDRQWAVFLGNRVLAWGAEGFWPQLTRL